MNKRKSFTLIELLVVIVIIGILAGVIMISTSSSIDKANFAKAQAFSSTIQNELLSNLVSEWTFDNASNIGEDTWGNNHGTLYGSAGSQNLPQLQSTSKCVFGTCLKFDGTDDRIDCGNDGSLQIRDKITLSAWGKTSSTITQQIIAKDDSINRNYLLQYNSSSNIPRFIIWINNEMKIASNSATIVDGNWHHIVGTYDGNNVKIYVDGILGDVVVSTSGNIDNDIVNLTIGNLSNATGLFNGLIDNIRIYDAALSSSQIKQNYIAGLNSVLANGNISKQEYNERLEFLSSN
jgi:prepilin-type N-terminal cleavage/methylation domain-containing protein